MIRFQDLAITKLNQYTLTWLVKQLWVLYLLSTIVYVRKTYDNINKSFTHHP